MKKHVSILSLVPAVVCALLLAACGGKETPWFHNSDVVIAVVDAAGKDLLDDYENPDNILSDGVTVTYKGQTYPLSVPATRAEYVPPVLGGLTLQVSWNKNIPSLMVFGEFGIVSDGSLGVKKYRGERFTINWGDEERLTSELEFDMYTDGGGEGGTAVRKAVRVVGGVGAGTVSNSSLNITIVK
ncbi:MAG: hypothetical protein LBU98_00725 [Alistipes sp.]|jgi:hypothetical protein|nr:hypothetical protein [Alistipes sp.]